MMNSSGQLQWMFCGELMNSSPCSWLKCSVFFAKVRYLNEEFCDAVLGMLHPEGRLADLSPRGLSCLAHSSAQLDVRHKSLDFCWERLVEGKDRIPKADLVQLLTALPVTQVSTPVTTRLLALLSRIPQSEASTWGALERRILLLGNAMALSMIPYVPEVLQRLRTATSLRTQEKDSDFNPPSSGFHVEVAQTLALMEVQHTMEEKHSPFIHDITMSRQQLDKMISEEESEARKQARIEAALAWALDKPEDVTFATEQERS
mmetsp:Transcript_82775/g.189223  ORF Transcript_82775/g.189223 Transcript_82775/m.189223 type:complete len:261 (+) Transcript_82775:727-1509(+)